MQVEKFCNCVYVRHLKSLVEGLLIIWGWSDSKDDETAQSDEEKSLLCNNLSTEADLSEDEWQNKCSQFQVCGSTRDALYQYNLKKALYRKEGRSVGLGLMAQHDNTYNSHAVAFECQVDGSWGVFGYVIKELLGMLSRNSDSCTKKQKLEEVKTACLEVNLFIPFQSSN